jgi:hypothetical protein
VPPAAASAKVVVDPIHTVIFPVIGAIATTVTVVVDTHPAGDTYVITVEPTTPAVTNPVVAPIEATLGTLLLHVPPVGVAVNVSVPPGHRDVGGVNVGMGFMITRTSEVSCTAPTVFITW